MKVVGLMSGTSLDGVDAVLLETDGEVIERFGVGLEIAYSKDERAILQAAVDAALHWQFIGPQPDAFQAASNVLLETQTKAVEAVCKREGIRSDSLDLVGFHGQTVLHRAPTPDQPGQTCQIGDGQGLANRLGCPVIYDFRSADVAAGGQGAPLAPIYHDVLARSTGLKRPLAVLNIGGVANVTFLGADGSVSAFDTGPGNGLLDAWMEDKTGVSMDQNGAASARGRVHEASLNELMDHPHFKLEGPKSLDRWDFSLEPLRNLTLEDGAATLSEFTAQTISESFKWINEAPQFIIVCGGGRKNPILIQNIEHACKISVLTAEAVGWRGDLIEAEAFAVLAARSARSLSISGPEITGAPEPLTGGQLVRPQNS